MKNQNLTFTFILSCIILLGCTGVEITKRKHRKGYHVQWRNKTEYVSKVKPIKQEAIVKEETDEIEEFQGQGKSKKESSIIVSQQPFNHKRIREGISHEIKSETNYSKSESNVIEFVLENNENSSDNSRWPVYAGLLVSSFGMLAFKKRLKKVSKWASRNKKRAQVVFGLASTGLIGISAMASVLTRANFSLLETLTLGLIAASVVTYSIIKRKLSWIKSKITVFILSVCLSGIAFNGFGLNNSLPLNTRNQIEETSIGENLNNVSKVLMGEVEAAELVGKIILTLILSVLFLGFLYVLAAITCTIACGGAEILALVIAVGGLIGGSTLFGYFTLRIFYGKRKKDISREDQNMRYSMWLLFTLLFAVVPLGVYILLVNL